MKNINVLFFVLLCLSANAQFKRLTITASTLPIRQVDIPFSDSSWSKKGNSFTYTGKIGSIEGQNLRVGVGGDVMLTSLGSNLTTNGNFSAGNAGFTSDNSSTSTRDTTSNNAGYYRVASAPVTNWTSYVETHRANGNMMLVNMKANGLFAWRQSSISVVAGNSYVFQVDAYSLTATLPNEMPRIFLRVDGITVSDTVTLETMNEWKLITGIFRATTSKTVTIEVVPVGATAQGFNFALDNIQFRQILTGNNSMINPRVETVYDANYYTKAVVAHDISKQLVFSEFTNKDSIVYRGATNSFFKYSVNGDINYSKSGVIRTVANTSDLSALFKSAVQTSANNAAGLVINFENINKTAVVDFNAGVMSNLPTIPVTTTGLSDGMICRVRFSGAYTAILQFPSNVLKKDGTGFGTYTTVPETLIFHVEGSNLVCDNK